MGSLVIVFVSLVLASQASSFFHESTFFHNVGQFSMSRSRWLISFVIDLGVYENFLSKLSSDIDNAAKIAHQLVIVYDKTANDKYKHIFDGFRNEIEVLRSIHSDIVMSFNDYKLLRDSPTRVKRGLFNFVGSIMNSLFGVLTEADVEKIQSNVRKVAQNQLDLTHVLKESITILNVTRLEVKENRQKINEIIIAMEVIEKNIVNITGQMQTKINNVESLAVFSAQLNLIIDNIKNALSRSMYFYLHFQMQVQMITMQRLSPSTISANDLRQLLLVIQSRLPKTIGLPHDPLTKLFEYYKFLTCVTLIEGNHVIITIQIPLVEHAQTFEVYKAYSLPVPLIGATPHDKKELLAYYRLESNYLAINPERTRYMLLDDDHAYQCSDPTLKICNVKEPIRNVNVGKSCILSNFMEDKRKVKKHCNVWMKHSFLPTAIYLINDVYLIITKREFGLNIVCNDKRSSKKKFQVQPPYGFLNLHKNCIATSNAFTLMGYYERHTNENVTNPAIFMLKSYNFTDFRLWDDITRLDVIQNNTMKLPKKLDDLQEFPLNTLLDHLDRLQVIEEMKFPKHFPLWGYLIIVVCIVVAILIFGFIFKKYKYALFSKLIRSKRNTKKKSRTKEQIAIDYETKELCEKEESDNRDVMVMSKLLANETQTDTCEAEVHRRVYPILDVTRNSSVSQK